MARDPIAELVHLYADAVVNHDAEQWSATWTEDAVWDLGLGAPVEGREAIVDLWRSAMDGFDAVIQTVFNGTHHLDDGAGTGTGRWYVQEAYRRTDGGSGLLIAHYDDVYRLDQRWRFAARTLVAHYTGPPDLSGRFLGPRS